MRRVLLWQFLLTLQAVCIIFMISFYRFSLITLSHSDSNVSSYCFHMYLGYLEVRSASLQRFLSPSNIKIVQYKAERSASYRANQRNTCEFHSPPPEEELTLALFFSAGNPGSRAACYFTIIQLLYCCLFSFFPLPLLLSPTWSHSELDLK